MDTKQAVKLSEMCVFNKQVILSARRPFRP